MHYLKTQNAIKQERNTQYQNTVGPSTGLYTCVPFYKWYLIKALSKTVIYFMIPKIQSLNNLCDSHVSNRYFSLQWPLNHEPCRVMFA